jgi:Fe-S cluster assembly protein SufD
MEVLDNKTARETTAMNTPNAVLDPIRVAAGEVFDRVGLPTGKEEQWRFTQVQPILRSRFVPAEPEYATDLFEQYTFGDDASVEIVLVNGVLSRELSRISALPEGVCVTTLAKASQNKHAGAVRQHLGKLINLEQHPFAAMNTRDFADGVYVEIHAGAVVEAPIHVLQITIGNDNKSIVNSPRVLVIAGDNCEATIVESFVGQGSRYLCNAVTEVIAGRDCRIDHCKLQQESHASYHVANMHAVLGENAQFVSHAVTIGARISRNDLAVKLNGRNAYAALNGVVLIGDVQHCDNHTLLDHAAPDCPSHELYKHVLADKASAVFKGQIYVNQIAQKTNAKQSSKALLLSDQATMNSMPALEIYADDVKCTHGSTTGPIDEDLVFYLRSRGVSFEAARHLLTYAFAADVTRRIKVAPVRRRVEDFMAAQHGLPQDLRINDLGAFDEDVIR